MAVQEISVDELADRLAADIDGAIRLIDVREVYEYEDGHVAGAQLIVLSDVPTQVDHFRSDGPVFVICRSGARSRTACEFLATNDIEAINVAGGTMAWMMSGRDVVTGGAPS